MLTRTQVHAVYAKWQKIHLLASGTHVPPPLAHFLLDLRESHGSPLARMGVPNPWTQRPPTPLCKITIMDVMRESTS